jgi:hypothetical protein
MRKDIKIGDIVENCSLMPGIVMDIKGNDIYIRRLDVDQYNSSDYLSFSNCSLTNCGIVKITSKQAIQRLVLGMERLRELWDKNGSYNKYIAAIEVEYDLTVTDHNNPVL